MKKILVVDDEKTFRDSLVSALEASDDQFYILSAENGKNAVQMLESESFDLVVTDLKMPEMDGFELLAFMNSHHKSTPVVVMSAYGTSAAMKKISAFSPLSFLNKPFKLEELLKVVHEGLGQKESVHGSLMGVSLTNFLQLIEMEKKSCLLEVKVPRGERGYIYCSNGELYDAFFENMKSEEAVIKMLTLSKVDISFKDLPKKRILKRINKNILSLIMDATAKGDKSVKKEKKAVPGKNDVPTDGKTEAKDQIKNEEKSASAEDATSGKGVSQQLETIEPNNQILEDAVEALKEDLGEGLISIDFFGAENPVSLAGHNSKPETFELINRLTEYLTIELDSDGHGGLGKYYLLELSDGNLAVTILHGEYRCKILVDSDKTELGHLIKDVIPMVIESIDGALTY